MSNFPNDSQLDALFAKARNQRPDTSVAEFAFETRLMARLREREEAGSAWAWASWRMVPFFVVLVVGLMVWRSEVVTEADDAAQVAYVENSTATGGWGNL